MIYEDRADQQIVPWDMADKELGESPFGSQEGIKFEHCTSTTGMTK